MLLLLAKQDKITEQIEEIKIYRYTGGHMERNIDVIKDAEGNNIVIINDIIFKGKRSINWEDVKKYLKNFVGEVYKVLNTNDNIYIGADLPNEYSGSKYTYSLKGTAAKAKANVSQGIPELIEIAAGRHFRKNTGQKHNRNAKYGWYRYDSRFALPVYDSKGGDRKI